MHHRRLFFVFFVVFIHCFVGINSTASNSLANCQTAASAFLTTISYTAANITGTAGVNVSCPDTTVICPGKNISGVCVWQRKLSAVCRNASGVIKIRIQTNGLPPRCASVPMGTFVELNVDFEVNFNPDVSVNSPNQVFNSQGAMYQTICILTGSTTVPSASGFVNYGTTLVDTVSGVSVDGVLIFTPDSLNNVDPFFPPPSVSTEMVDSCLAHCQASGVYHYHISTGCMVNPPSGAISSCASVSACSSNIATYAISSFSNYQTLIVIGVAKDGHVIYGPYLSSNNRVTSGFDACNGMFYDSIGNYAYFATSTYPYIVGCFGPANYPSFGPNCTTNGPSSYNMSSYARSFYNSSSSSTTVSSSSTLPSNSSTVPSSSTSSSNSSTVSSSSASPSNSSTASPLSAAVTRNSSTNVRWCLNNILFFFCVLVIFDI